MGLKLRQKLKIIWDSIPFAVIWSIWNARNQLMFKNKEVNWMKTSDLIKARVAFWVLTKKDGCAYSMDDIIDRLHSIVKSG
ncbi:hypothetical protein RHMOL_Rhmol12G0148300 [Rhododendron molle]|uniref:Uncharacterized protein n=1 Tax=Rhododendron molle TaxID=49168 RepID=A0ACC0LJE5_RHOML|nr:hypothetical protein RHMOL_Rhmol12G0148300 [Rhododendron molle]